MKEAQVITVATAEKDNYGNLKVTDQQGNEYKIGEKRSQLFQFFIPSRAVKITWDNYNRRDYISDAELFDGKPPAEEQIEPITAGVGSSELARTEQPAQPTPASVAKQAPAQPTPASVAKQAPAQPTPLPGQQIGMTVKEIGDMIRADKLMHLFGQEVGMNLVVWYRGQILGTTKVSFDGAKLP